MHETARDGNASEISFDFRDYVTIPTKDGESLMLAAPPDWKLVIWGVWNWFSALLSGTALRLHGHGR